MTLFFNFDNIDKEAKHNPIMLIKLLREFNNPSKLMKHGLRQKFRGHSYLLNPEGIINDRNTDILFIQQYLILASKRDYALYKLYGVKSLPLSHYSDIKLDSIKHNPLLTITNTDIHFKYEEI